MTRSVFMFIFFMILGFVRVNGQNETQSTELSSAFDFWVGDWEVHWQNPDSSYTYANNLIEKTLDARVIQENFNDSTSGFKGTSISVFSLADSTWHQAWADNAGGYFDFYGIVDGDMRIFQTHPKVRNGEEIIQRMVFSDIKEDSFLWNWESSKDKGVKWNLVWQIFYERK